MPANVTLAWDASSSGDADGYKVYWGTQSAVYPNVQDVGNTLVHIVPNLTQGQNWYFAVTAYNEAGESAFSAELVSFLASTEQFLYASAIYLHSPVVRQVYFNF